MFNVSLTATVPGAITPMLYPPNTPYASSSYAIPSALPVTPAIPQHALLTMKNKENDLFKQQDAVLPRRLRHDFIARRSQATVMGTTLSTGPMEQSLAACCSSPDGALSRAHVAAFVGHLCLYGGDVAARALGLAILERALEQDAIEQQARRESVQQWRRQIRPREKDTDPGEKDDEEEDDPDYSNHDDEEGSSPEEGIGGAAKMTAASIGTTTPRRGVPPSMDPQRVHPNWNVEPSRWQLFLRAGGLKILSRWFLESTQPTKLRSEGSPTALLLPLLQFLYRAPLTVKEIRKSQLHIHFKQWQDSLPNDPAALPEDLTTAAKALKKLWKDKGKESSSKDKDDDWPECTVIPDPFAHVHALIADRLRVWEQYEASLHSTTTVPPWITNVLAKQRQSEENPKNKTPLSMTLMAKRTLALEREEYEKRQKQRHEDVIMERKRKNEFLEQLRQKQRKPPPVVVEPVGRGRMVRWKDGHDSKSLTKQKNLLEEVLIFVKEEEFVGGGMHDDLGRSDDVVLSVEDDDDDDDDEDDWAPAERRK